MSSKLRQRFVEDMKLAGLAESTQETYVSVLRKLARTFNKSPKYLSSEEIRKYLVHLYDRGCSHDTVIVCKSALNFLYTKTLGRGKLPLFSLVRRRRRRQHLPTALTREQVSVLLKEIKSVPVRMCLTVVYACGLRISEALNLKVKDINKQRMLLLVRNGKGRKDRTVPLPHKLLLKLRKYWKQVRPKDKLFNLTRSKVYCTLKAVADKVGIDDVSPHTLRRSYAVHLLDSGMPLGAIQQILGHTRLQSMVPYLRGYKSNLENVRPILETSVADF